MISRRWNRICKTVYGALRMHNPHDADFPEHVRDKMRELFPDEIPPSNDLVAVAVKEVYSRR